VNPRTAKRDETSMGKQAGESAKFAGQPGDWLAG
jgi:hypothetical protein